MKILFHINSLGLGGAERVVSILSEYFIGDKIDVVIATQWEEENEYPLPHGANRISVGFTEEEESRYHRVQKIVLRHKKLRDCIKRENPDVVISFCVKANYRAAISMLGMKIPLIVSVRNDPKIDYVGRSSKVMNFIMERKAKFCVFQTKEAQEFFTEKFQQKSVIIYNPIGQQYLQEEIVKTRNKTIVTVGRMVKQKNQVVLLQAMAKVHNAYPEYQLELYGEEGKDGSKEGILEIIKSLDMKEYVTLMGVTDNIKGAIKESAMFILPSTYEGMPNALIEALVMGIPCISTDCPCGGPATLIINEKSGLLVPVGDVEALELAMKEMIANPERAEEMGREAMKLVQMVHPDNVYKQWKQLVFSA